MSEEEKSSKVESGNDDSLEPGELSGNSTPNASPKATMPSSSLEALRVSYKDDNDDNDSHQPAALYSHPSNIGSHISFRGGFVPHFRGGPRGRGHLHWNRGGFNQGNKMIREQMNENRIEHYRKSNQMPLNKKLNYTKTKPTLSWQINTFYPKKVDTIVEKELSQISKTSSERTSRSLDRKSDHKNDSSLSKKNSVCIKKPVFKIYKKHSRGKVKKEKVSKYKESKFKKRSDKIKDKYKRKREKIKKYKKEKKRKESEEKCEEPHFEEESTTPPPKKSRIEQLESEKLIDENEKNAEDKHFTPEKKILIEKIEPIEKKTIDKKVTQETEKKNFSEMKTPTDHAQTPDKKKSGEKKTSGEKKSSGEKKTGVERKSPTPQNKEKVKKALQLDLRLSFVDELDYEDETLISDVDVDAFPLTKDETVCAVDSKKQKKKLEKLENNIADDNSSSPDTDDYQDMWEEDVDMTINKETDIEFESKDELIVSKDLKPNRTDDEILNNLKLVKDQIKHELSRTLDKKLKTKVPEKSPTKKLIKRGFKADEKILRNKKQKENKSGKITYNSKNCESKSSPDSKEITSETKEITSEELRDGLGTPLFLNPSPPKDLVLQSTPESTTPPLTPPICNVKIERKLKKDNIKGKEQPIIVKPTQKYLFGMQDIYEQFIQSVNNDHGIDLSVDAKKSKENPKKISPIKPPRVDIFEEDKSPKIIEKSIQNIEEKTLIPLNIPPITPVKLKPLVAPMIKTPVMKSITSPSSSETDSSSDSEDSESDSSSTTVSEDEIFTRDDKKKLRAFEKRLVTLTTWLASDEEEKKLFEGLQELIQNQIKLMKHKYSDKLAANKGKPVCTVLTGMKKPITEQQKEEQQKRHLEMIPRIIQPKIPAALQEIPMHLPSDKLLAQHKTASNKFPGIIMPSLSMSTMIFSIEKDFKDPKDYKEVKETKPSGDTKFESKDSKSSREVKDNKENRYTSNKESKEIKHSKEFNRDSKDSKSSSKSSNIKSKTNKMEKHTDKRRRSPKRSRSPQFKHKSTSRAPSPASSKKSSSSRGTSGRRSASPKKNIKSLKKSNEIRRKRRSRSRSPIAKRIRTKRSDNQTVRKPSAPPTPPSQRHRIVYSRSRSRSPLSPRNFKRRSLSPIADFRRSASPQYRRSISPQYRRSNSPIFRKYSPSPERFRPPSPPSPETLQRDVSRSPSHYRSSPSYNRRFPSRSRSVSPEYQDHRHHIENLTPVRWSDEQSIQYYPEEYQYRLRQDSAYHAYNTQFNSYSDYMPTLGEDNYSTYDYDQQTSGYSSSSSFEQNYYYNEYDSSVVYDSLQAQPTGSLQHDSQQVSSNLRNIPVITVENSTTVAVQKGNVLEIVPTNIPQSDESKSEVKIEEKKKRKISWKEEVDRRNVLSAILKLNRESEGGSLKSILIKTNPEESKIKEKKTVLFSDGIKPGSGPNDDKGGLIVKTEKKKRKKKSAEKPILQENKENVDALDPELENADPPPPPPGSPPPHLQQPVLKRPTSPDIILYFHFDPIVNSMYVSRNPNPIPPRLLVQKSSNPNGSSNKNQSGSSHIIPKKAENQNVLAPEKIGEKMFYPSRIPNRFSTPPPTHLMGQQLPIGPRISVATVPIIPPMPIAAPMNFPGHQRFPRYPISGCNFSIPPPNNQFQKSFHIPVLTRIPTLNTTPYQHQIVAPKGESIPVFSSDSGGYYKKDNTTTPPSLPGPIQKFLRNEMKILSPIQPPSPSQSSSSSSPKISSSSSSSPRPASPKLPHTKISFDSNSARISSLSKLVTTSQKLSDVSKNGAQDLQDLESIASVREKKVELSEEKNNDNNKEIKSEVGKTCAESLEPVDV